MRSLLLTALFFVGLSLNACHSSPPTVTAAFFDASGKELVTVALEIASTNAERQKGLMFRKSLEPKTGMLFIFPDSAQRAFWMKDTYIPLDMFFINQAQTVIGVIENATPLSEEQRIVYGESMYVVELPAGSAKEFGIGSGSKFNVAGEIPRGV